MRATARTNPLSIALRRPPTVALATFAVLALASGSGGAAVALTGASPELSGPLPPASAPPSVTRPDEPTTATPTWSAPDTADTTGAEPRYDAPVEVLGVAQPDLDAALSAPGAEKVVEVPTAALTAYLATEQVLARADRSCRVRWNLVAAVGRVLSDHGEPGRHRLDAKGIVTPKLVGKRLEDGRGRLVRDTDAGQLDGDRRGDRGVGPMLLDPATWSTVGVDGDANGRRNPQDIDDAALAVGVLLCSGREDLRERDEKRAAVRRLSDEPGFARDVLGVARAYWADLQSHAAGVVGPDSFTFTTVTPEAFVPTAVTAAEPADTPAEPPTEDVVEALDDADGGLSGDTGDGDDAAKGGDNGSGSGGGSGAGGSVGGGSVGGGSVGGGNDGGSAGGGSVGGGDAGGDDSGEPSDPPAEPDVVDPPAEPEPTEPAPTEPEPVQPESTQAAPAQPETAQPQDVQPQPEPGDAPAGGNDPAPEPEQPDGVCRPEEDLSTKDPDCEQDAGTGTTSTEP